MCPGNNLHLSQIPGENTDGTMTEGCDEAFAKQTCRDEFCATATSWIYSISLVACSTVEGNGRKEEESRSSKDFKWRANLRGGEQRCPGYTEDGGPGKMGVPLLLNCLNYAVNPAPLVTLRAASEMKEVAKFCSTSRFDWCAKLSNLCWNSTKFDSSKVLPKLYAKK